MDVKAVISTSYRVAWLSRGLYAAAGSMQRAQGAHWDQGDVAGCEAFVREKAPLPDHCQPLLPRGDLDMIGRGGQFEDRDGLLLCRIVFGQEPRSLAVLEPPHQNVWPFLDND